VATTLSSHPIYRPDIDGLRAIAVLTVVAYHAFPHWLRGGFIGVDIFFAISGFLISTIIFQNLERGTFSFADFYSRRVRRIFPALIAVFAACFAFGWYVLLPHEFKQLGQHIAGGAAFISNFLLWQESGYFDNLSDTKPLLHLWSLGIEEQFYILWPLLLWAAHKLKLNSLVLILTIGALSFSLNIYQVRANEIATFYSPQTRIWELLIGAGLAYLLLYPPQQMQKALLRVQAVVSPKALSNLCASAGLFAIVVGLLLIMRGRHFPGVWPLLPAGGAALIILAGSQAWINRQILANPLLVWVGLISYPLYLWHWPLLSFARIVEAETPSVLTRSFAIVLSIALAWVTYRLIEKPFRFGKHGVFKTGLLLALMATIGFAGYYTYAKDGLKFRGPQIAGPEAGNDGGYPVKALEECGLSEEDKPKFTCLKDSRPGVKYALLGDSKALAILSGLMRTSLEEGRWLMIANGSKATPVPLISQHPAYQAYQPGIALAVKAINANPEIENVVFVTATRNLFQLKNDTDIEDLEQSPFYEAALKGLQATIDQFKAANKKVTLVVDNPTLPHPEDCLLRVTESTLLNSFLKTTLNKRCQLPLERHLLLSKKYRDLLAEVAKNNPDTVKIFDTTPFLCDSETGLCETKQNGKLMYIFTDHISDYAAGKIGQSLNPFLQSVGATGQPSK
jgi:peptidoglycan/LPS O-acetylase OafA/YrhL